MVNLKGKKLLIIGGAFQHCKLVEAAKTLGVITYVTDYLPVEDAPAKQIADRYFMHDVMDTDAIVTLCREEGIDGVISTSLDACQKPYFRVCAALGLPCFGTEEQFHILTDKAAFKEHCRMAGVDVIPAYSLRDFETEAICNQTVSFPILVKPGESRGSRGQSICYTYADTCKAIAFAKQESSNGDVVIEKYMGQANDFSMTLLVINGKAYPFRTVDRFLGKYEDGLDKLAVGSASPSTFTDIYLEKAHAKIEAFIKHIGLVNAPLFMQGFVDGDCIRFYDPGLRLPGGEFERMFLHALGKNPFYPLIEFALTGTIDESRVTIRTEDIRLGGKTAGQILPPLRPGTIAQVEGVEEIRRHPDVVAVFPRFKVGDTVRPTHNVNQRYAEIDIVCDTAEAAAQLTAWIYATLKVTDENGENMLISQFDPSLYVERNRA